MPRSSKRKRFIRELRSVFRDRLIRRACRTINDDEDSDEDMVDWLVAVRLHNAERCRFLFRKRRYRRSGDDRFAADLVVCDEAQDNNKNEEESTPLHVEATDIAREEAIMLPRLMDDDFLHKYRISRRSFDLILNEIEDHNVFKRKTPRGRSQAPVAHQLMVFLTSVGTEGAGGSNSNQRNNFSIGYGTADIYRK